MKQRGSLTHRGPFNPALKVGDVVDLVLPASGLPAEIISQAETFLNSWGLKARYPKDILNPHPIFAQSDEKRFQFLKDALLNKQSKAVWCLRGGYGSIRLLPALQKLKKPENRKLFIGISDVTSLHLFLNQKWGWSTYHASLIDRLAKNTLPSEIQEELKQVLFGSRAELSYAITPCNQKARQMKRTEAKIVGGNLVTIQSSLGTPFEIKTQKKFLFFEEIGERGYRMDRMMEHLDQAGKFKDCAGLLVGHVVGGEEPTVDPQKKGISTWGLVFDEWLKRLKIPVFSGVPSGHGTDLHCIPFNTSALIERQGAGREASEQFELKISTGVKGK